MSSVWEVVIVGEESGESEWGREDARRYPTKRFVNEE